MVPQYDVERIRADLPVLETWTYLNTGTVGVTPQPVLEAELDYIRDYESMGHTGQARAQEHYETARRRLAGLLQVDSSEIAFNRNATDGINTVAAGFKLNPGDEVIISTEEHPAMHVPWMLACHRQGAALKYLEVTPDQETFAERLRAASSPNTRLIALSHVSCETGTRLPLELVREIVGDDIAILVDASQSVGQFPISVTDFQADFVIGNGHKWLAGPTGTGFIWINPASIELIPPVFVASESIVPRWSRQRYQFEQSAELQLADGAARYEFGTRSWHLYGALADAIDYQSNLGWGNIEAHMASLTQYAKSQLAELEGVQVLSPATWPASSALVAFSVDGMRGERVSELLWNDFNIAQRRVEIPSAVRISCAYFNTLADIDRLMSALEQIVSG